MAAIPCYNVSYMKYYDFKGEECTEKYYLQYRDAFIAKCQVLVDEHMRNHHWDEKLSVTKGRRYDKIVQVDVGFNRGGPNGQPQSRVWAFIDKTNGDILKPAHWNKPAKHPRGNIYEDDCMQFIGSHGPAYMDTIKEYYS